MALGDSDYASQEYMKDGIRGFHPGKVDSIDQLDAFVGRLYFLMPQTKLDESAGMGSL